MFCVVCWVEQFCRDDSGSSTHQWRNEISLTCLVILLLLFLFIYLFFGIFRFMFFFFLHILRFWFTTLILMFSIQYYTDNITAHSAWLTNKLTGCWCFQNLCKQHADITEVFCLFLVWAWNAVLLWVLLVQLVKNVSSEGDSSSRDRSQEICRFALI